jgi:diacylglycerol kinase (ATP)
METYTFIINPMAGKGRGKKLLQTLDASIHDSFPDPEIIITRARMHAYEIASERKYDADRVVIAVGGDGTVNEVGNGLIGGNAAMSVIPIGSGNDFVKMFQIPTDIHKAIERIRNGTVRDADAGHIEILNDDGSTVTRYFANGIGIGFDAAVAHQTTKFKHLRGVSLYAFSVALVLFNYKTPNMMMAMNGAIMNGQHFLIAIGNGKCAGGGFYLTPEAEIDDGLLDVCLVDNITIPQVVKIFPRVMKGSHKNHEKVHFYKTDALRVEAQEPIKVHADGEVLSTSARNIDIKVMPKALKVLS